MNKLLSKEANDPVRNKKITLKKLMQTAYSKGANLSSINPYEVDHFGSVKDQPFSNLRILPYRINRVQGLLKNKADQAKAGFLKPETAKMYTPEKIKNYLQKSGYNFTKNTDQIFKDEVKLANEILVEGRVLRTPIEIGKSIEEQKFTKLLDIPGVKRASEIERPEAAVERDMFKAFNERISLQKNIPVKEVKQDVSEVSKVLKNMTNKMGSGVDPTDIAKYIAAEAKDLAAFGKKYGGDILKDVAEKEQSLLGKIGTGALKTVGALDLPIMQVAFGSMQNWEEDSPLWVTLPAAFTDEIADAFNLYKKTGGKAKEFGKFLASSFVPRAARSPLFKAVSKAGKIGSVATPLLELGQEAYKFEKQKRMLPEIARQFDIPIEEARKGFENYIRSTIPQDLAGQGLDETTVPESPGLPRLKRTFQDIGSIFGLSESPYKDPNAQEEPITISKPSSTERGFVAEGGRIGFEDGTDPKKPKGLGSLSKRNFLKTLALIPAGIMAIRGGPNLLKKAKPAVEALKNAPPHFQGLVNKIMTLGKIVKPKYTSEDIAKNYTNYRYKDYDMLVNKSDGRIEITKPEFMATEYGDATVSEEYMSYNPKSPKFNKKGEKIPDEYEDQYEEYTTYADSYGEMSNVEEGVKPTTMDDGTFTEDELAKELAEQIEQNIKKGKK